MCGNKEGCILPNGLNVRKSGPISFAWMCTIMYILFCSSVTNKLLSPPKVFECLNMPSVNIDCHILIIHIYTYIQNSLDPGLITHGENGEE